MQRKAQQSEGSSSTGPHRMRITSGGDVAGYVNFALTFLKENAARSLVLHTLPAEKEAGSSNPKSPTTTSGPLTSVLLATPKLVSVVEKIKREYMTWINTSESGKGKNKAVGIWQYNESGVLPGPEQEDLGLDSILEGRKKPKMVHRPYLQITLSTRPLGLEEGAKGRYITCQYVMVRRRKHRSKQSTVPTAPGSTTAAPAKVVIETERPNERRGVESADAAVKRKADGSQVSDSVRGGKKRKKQG